MEGLQLVGVNGGLIVVQRVDGVLATEVMGIIVRIDGLGFEARDGVELLNSGRAEAGQCAKHDTLDLGDLGVLNAVDERLLGFAGGGLESLSSVLLAKRSDMIVLIVMDRSLVHQNGACRVTGSDGNFRQLDGFRFRDLQSGGACEETGSGDDLHDDCGLIFFEFKKIGNGLED